MKENKVEVICKIEELCHMTRTLEDIVITTGYIDYTKTYPLTNKPVFVPSKENVKYICFTWKDQDYMFGRLQSIEGDNGYGIICDAMKVITKLA